MKTPIDRIIEKGEEEKYRFTGFWGLLKEVINEDQNIIDIEYEEVKPLLNENNETI